MPRIGALAASVTFVSTLLAPSPAPLAAQRLGPEVPRPRITADTNDAQSYFDYGMSTFEANPRVSAAAFYWAARINPAWAEPLYARRAALLMADRSMLRKQFEGNRRTKDSPEFRRLDSLQFRALMLNPFLYRRLDHTMFTAYIRASVMERGRMSGGDQPSEAELDYYIDQYLKRAGPWMRAWLAYGRADFAGALKSYEDAFGITREKSGIRLERGRIFGMIGQVDSAVAQMRLAVTELRNQDQKDLVVFYDSKAQVEYSIATLLEGADDIQGAHEAYGEALQEDLSYYPAHMRLGLLALSKRDTATAVSELALASQLAADEPFIRYTNGYVLGVARRHAEAVAELQRVVELEPNYALPYLRLGQIYEMMGKGPEAAAGYQGFLDHASRGDLQRELATARLTEIKEILASMPKP